jgi:hypothetical protein
MFARDIRGHRFAYFCLGQTVQQWCRNCGLSAFVAISSWEPCLHPDATGGGAYEVQPEMIDRIWREIVNSSRG